jgi:hypothetical protein
MGVAIYGNYGMPILAFLFDSVIYSVLTTVRRRELYGGRPRVIRRSREAGNSVLVKNRAGTFGWLWPKSL